MNATHSLAKEPFSAEEAEALVTAQLIGHRGCNPIYKHIVRRIQSYLAKARLQTLEDKGERLLKYVSEADLELRDVKVLELTALVRKLKPKIIYEFGAGATTCLFAELLKENEEKFGVHGELHSFEQSENYFNRMTSSMPEPLQKYITWHQYPSVYEWNDSYRTLHYQKPSLPHREIDLVYVDGPSPIAEGIDYPEYAYFNSDLVDLINDGVIVNLVIQDQRWFNVQFFRHHLPQYHSSISMMYKSFRLSL